MNVRGLAYLSIYVSDTESSRGFYGGLLGLPVVDEQEWGVLIQAGSVQLFLHPRHGDQRPQNLEMTFTVDDADAAVADLRSHGVSVVEEVIDREWGDRDGAVTDPDGNVLYLRSGSRAI